MSSTQTKPPLVLPSIREMFPDYLMGASPQARMARAAAQRTRITPRSQTFSHPTQPTSIVSSSRRHSIASDLSPSGLRPRVTHLPHASQAPTAAAPTNPASHRSTHSDISTKFSFDVLRSDPSSSSLQHIASSATFPNRGGSSAGYNPQGEVSNGSAPAFRVSVPEATSRTIATSRLPRSSAEATVVPPKQEATRLHDAALPGSGYSTVLTFPLTGSMNGPPSERGESPDDPDNASDGDISPSNGKKHICPTCSKRFNRPSSLRIHVNTHTGATPFRCPWPNCGREFNVNSNMRRHHRNHTTPGFSRPQSNDNRRRRRRGAPHGVVFVSSQPSPTSQLTNPPFMTPPISSLSINEDSDEDMSDPVDNEAYQDEEDELDSLPGEPSPTTERVYPTPMEAPDKSSYDRVPFNRYSQSHMRSAYRGPHSDSGSLSPPPNPALYEHMYSPSAPYIRSFADTRVSTALRPAFHSPSAVSMTQSNSDVLTSDVR